MKTFDGYKKQALTDSYVLLAGGGHKEESSLSVNYAASAGNADTLDGKHDGELTAAYFEPKLLTSDNTLDDISDGVWKYINADNPTNSVGNNSALLQISGRYWDRFQLAFPGNNEIVCFLGQVIR